VELPFLQSVCASRAPVLPRVEDLQKVARNFARRSGLNSNLLELLLKTDTAASRLAVEPNHKVRFDVKVFDAKTKELLETDLDEGVTYVHGYGQLVPGLERGLVGLFAGATKSITVPVHEAYGERDEDLVFVLPFEELGPEFKADDVEPGDALVLEDEAGDDALFHVLEVKEDGVALDGNHPLSGFSLRFDVTMISVTQATDEEVAEAATAYTEAEEAALGTLEESSAAQGLVTLSGKNRKDWSKN
jgi:FKBP-type peptidyl-prolyl cis-trans isomerase SlyD